MAATIEENVDGGHGLSSQIRFEEVVSTEDKYDPSETVEILVTLVAKKQANLFMRAAASLLPLENSNVCGLSKHKHSFPKMPN